MDLVVNPKQYDFVWFNASTIFAVHSVCAGSIHFSFRLFVGPSVSERIHFRSYMIRRMVDGLSNVMDEFNLIFFFV